MPCPATSSLVGYAVATAGIAIVAQVAPDHWWTSPVTILAAGLILFGGVIAKLATHIVERYRSEGTGYRELIASYHRQAVEQTDVLRELRVTNEKIVGHLSADIESRRDCLNARMILAHLRDAGRISDQEIANVSTAIRRENT